MAAVIALVDSGAHRSCFPVQIARQLRIKSKLKKDPCGAKGVGSKFTTWSSTVPLHGQIVATGRSGPALWGPRFRFEPAFVEDDDAFLLGRADFFNVFTVAFDRGPNSSFHLDY
ncbi:MAG: hypothetical protein WD844_03565 [Thermoleophilaceae bacterium]